jgi:hypothetical protein
MKNKTVIRKELESGQFTTIHHSILRDKRLSSNGFRLLINILSDSDTNFTLSQSLYCKRLGITKQTYFNAVQNLVECGYLLKNECKVNPIRNHYILSEYGNLKSEQANKHAIQSEIEKELPIKLETEIQTDIMEETKMQIYTEDSIEQVQDEFDITKLSENDKDLYQYLHTIKNLLEYDDFYKLLSYEWMLDDKIRTEMGIKKKVKEYLTDFYNENLALAKNPQEHPKALKEYKAWLKDEIFNNHNLGINARSKWSHLSLMKYKKPYKTDYETQMFDYYENPKD